MNPTAGSFTIDSRLQVRRARSAWGPCPAVPLSWDSGCAPARGWRAPWCWLAPSAPAGQCSCLSLCFLLQRHFCIFAVSFPGHEALLTIYSAILTQHLALQKVPVAVQRLQAQLVAAALGEPLPPRVGRAVRGSPCVACPVPGSRQQRVGGTSTPRHRAKKASPPPFIQFTLRMQHCVPRGCAAEVSGITGWG